MNLFGKYNKFPVISISNTVIVNTVILHPKILGKHINSNVHESYKTSS